METPNEESPRRESAGSKDGTAGITNASFSHNGSAGNGHHESPLSRVLARLEWKQSGDGYMARCPAHDDRTPSLSVKESGGKVLLNCFAGCTTEAVLERLGLTWGDTFPSTPRKTARTAPLGPIVATYDYRDEAGLLLFQVVRYDAPKKDFRHRRPDGHGGWVWKLKDDTRRVLYRLPDMLNADTVHIAEGEKDVDRLWALGIVSTTNAGGAEQTEGKKTKWRDEYNQCLADKHVVILPDNDDAEERHGLAVARALLPVAASVKVVRLPGLPPKGDVSDWLRQGHDKAELLALVDETPLWADGYRTLPRPSVSPPAEENPQAPPGEEEQAEPPVTFPEFNLTDLGNGERFVEEQGENLRYCNPWKDWLIWEDTHWERDKVQRVMTMARATVRGIYEQVHALVERIANATDKAERKALAAEQDRLLSHAMRSENVTRVTAMARLAEMDLSVSPAALDANTWLLNVANGTLDLRTGTLRPHARADLLTKCIPIVYDANAVCPQWEDFLLSVLRGNEETLDFLWRAVGYSLTGETREHCFFLLHGSGSNGKTTLLNVLLALTGQYGKQSPFSTFLLKDRETATNDLAALQGVRLAVASEAEEGRRLALSVVKALTGGDTISARFLFKEFVEFVPQMKIWLGTNHKPVIRGTDEAIWRRIRLIPFSQQYGESGTGEGTSQGEILPKDVLLPGKLRVELPGILAWAVRGCLAWQKDGFLTSEAIRKATANYRAESDVIGTFLNEECIRDERANVLTSSVYDAYIAWCKASGEDPIAKRSLGQQLQERGFDPRRGAGGIRLWKGLRLKE